MNKEKISAGSIFWGLLLIGVAAVLILEGIGVGDVYGVSVPGIALGILLIIWGVYLCVKKKFYMIFLPLGLFYAFVVDKPLAKYIGHPNAAEGKGIIPWWIVVIAAVLLCIAFKVLFTKKNVVEFHGGKTESGRLGTSTVYFDAADLNNATIRENVGTIVAYIANKEKYTGDGTVFIHENVGNIILHVPAEWLVVTDVSENLGKVIIPPQPEPTEQTLTIVIKENVGKINVEFDG